MNFRNSRYKVCLLIGDFQGLYEKLMSKYEADPEDPMAKFSRAQPKVSYLERSLSSCLLIPRRRRT